MSTWPSYVINLAANRQRLQRVESQFYRMAIEWQRLDAVNGWGLSEAEIGSVYDEEQNRRKAKLPLVKPEIGCYLSHYDAWKAIADGTAPGGFIFEDDLLAEDSLPEILELLSGDDGDWDMVKLFSFDQSPHCLSRRPLGESFELVEPYKIPTCLIGYGIRQSAAKKLVQRTLPFYRPVDEDMKFFWETGLKVALVLPPPILVGDQETVTGTIGSERRESSRKSGRARLAQTLKNLLYQIKYNLQLHYHRWKGS